MGFRRRCDRHHIDDFCINQFGERCKHWDTRQAFVDLRDFIRGTGDNGSNFDSVGGVNEGFVENTSAKPITN